MNARSSDRAPDQETRSPLESLADEELMRRIQAGDDVSLFNELVRRFTGELGRYLRHYLHDADAADDVLQTVWERIYRHRDQYRLERRVRPWLYGIATHSAIDWLRGNSRIDEQSLDQPPRTSMESSDDDESRLLGLVVADTRGPSSEAEFAEQRVLLRKAVRKLPDRLRSVVVLVSLLGMKHRDAAETLDVPVGTIKSRSHEAIRKLREELASSRGTSET